MPAAVLLLALYLVIFGFSAQNGEQSGSVSMQLSGKMRGNPEYHIRKTLGEYGGGECGNVF